jgi:hypothetical protein
MKIIGKHADACSLNISLGQSNFTTIVQTNQNRQCILSIVIFNEFTALLNLSNNIWRGI